MGIDILSVGISGLAAAQAGLATAGHNIANATTPGFHRQRILQATQFAQFSGSGYFGAGVKVNNVVRSYDQFLDAQVNSASSQREFFNTYSTQIQQIDNVLANTSTGLSPTLNSFFNAVNAAVANPSSSSRQALLSQGNILSAQFQSLNSRISESRASINAQVSSNVDQINSLASQIASLNQQIAVSPGGQSIQPNDLLDQRDQAISDLNKLVKTNSVKQSDGSINIFIGNGQTLVVGSETQQLVAAPLASNPSDYGVAVKTAAGLSPIGSDLLSSGGSLGALLTYREQSLDPAQNALGRIGIALAQTFNNQHQLGQDANGNIGGKFFNVGTPNTIANTDNTSTAVVAASISNVSALTTSNYQVNFDGSNYHVTRLSDGSSTSFSTLPQTVDGVAISISGTPAAGDSFLIQPTRNGASGISVAITDPALIALGTPVIASANNSNTGTGVAGDITVNGPPPVNANLRQTVTLTFGSSSTFDVSGTGTGNPTGVTYTAGGTITYNGWTFKITGTPKAGDTFTISANTGGTLDTRNGSLLAGLQTQNTIAGSVSYQGAYSQLVTSVGTKTQEVQSQFNASDTLTTQATDLQQSFSGVNLDEEAGDLVKFQQLYQASGQVIATASKLFDTLLQVASSA